MAVDPVESRTLFSVSLVGGVFPDVTVPATGAPMTVNVASRLRDPQITGTVVRMSTSNGNVDLMLYDSVKPVTVTNFLGYVNRGDYNGTIIHRTTTQQDTGLTVIQGGGYYQPGLTGGRQEFARIPTQAAIPNEFSANGVRSNVRGTISMAKTSDPNSATSQWFINVTDNSAALDNTFNAGGFTVFGEVIDNTMTNADAIQQLPRYNFGGAFSQLPLRNYTQGDFDAAAPTTQDKTVNVVSATVVPAITYAAGSSNSAVIAASLSGGILTLTATAGATGAADITVTGTGADGTVVTDTFTAAVGTSPSPQQGGPTAVFKGPKIAKKAYKFTLKFTDPEGVDVTSIDGNDVRVIGPNGFDRAAANVKVKKGRANRVVTATYILYPPQGAWATTDVGAYTVQLQAGGVIDMSGNAIGELGIGGFNVVVRSKPSRPGFGAGGQ